MAYRSCVDSGSLSSLATYSLKFFGSTTFQNSAVLRGSVLENQVSIPYVMIIYRNNIFIITYILREYVFLCRMYSMYAMEMNRVHCVSPISYYCASTFMDALVPAATTINLLNLLGMAIDHWITFIKPFRYFEVR